MNFSPILSEKARLTRTPKMPTYREPNFEEIENLADNGGVSKETKDKRDYVRSQFNDYLIKFFGGQNLKEMWDSPEMDESTKVDKLNLALSGFFESMTVKAKTGEKLPPKRNTAESTKSHLKKIFSEVTDLDLTCNKFKKFNVSTYYVLYILFIFSSVSCHGKQSATMIVVLI